MEILNFIDLIEKLLKDEKNSFKFNDEYVTVDGLLNMINEIKTNQKKSSSFYQNRKKNTYDGKKNTSEFDRPGIKFIELRSET